jgi:hypothetical protein
MHTCPGPGCKRQVPQHMLMCRNHWYQVPRDLRSDVWNAWQDGAGAGTIEHTEAILAAIKSIGGRI